MANVPELFLVGIVHTHMVAGYLGGFLTGLFATIEGCAAFALTNPGGAIDGNGRQVWLQIVGGLFVIGYNMFMTSVIMLFIKYVLRIPLRMKEEDLTVGDDAAHGEEAYALFFDGERNHAMLHAVDFESRSGVASVGNGGDQDGAKRTNSKGE